MLTSSRKAKLLEKLMQDGQLLVAPLAAAFGVSVDTLRRDLRELAAEGKLVRVHGGAIPASPTHLPLAARRTRHEKEKARLAQKAAGLIADGMIVIVDGGSTHLGLAEVLRRDKRCTVITHSPGIAASFEVHEQVEVVLVGGRIFRHSMVAMGPETARTLSRVTADLCFLDVTGVHPELGLTTGDGDEADLKRIMLDAASETIVLATADKVGRASPWQIEALAQLSTLITAGARPDWLPEPVDHLSA